MFREMGINELVLQWIAKSILILISVSPLSARSSNYAANEIEDFSLHLRQKSFPNKTRPPPTSNTPYILYTDILSGPVIGGENNKGAYLSIFGKNFANDFNKNGIKVFIGDVEVDNYRYFGPSLGREDVQQITVQVGSLGDPKTGVPLPIRVESSTKGSSNTDHSFIVQPGSFFFVDNRKGKDSTARRNDIDHPWRNVQTDSRTGALEVVGPGDFIVLRGGDVWSDAGHNNRFVRFIGTSGTSPTGANRAGPITITSYPGEDVRIKPPAHSFGGFHGVSGREDVYTQDADWITIANLRIEGGDITVLDSPINLQEKSDHWRIINNEIFNWAAADGSRRDEGGKVIPQARAGGISGNGTNIVIAGNHIHHISGGTLNHCIYLDTGSTDVEISYNHIHDCSGGNIIQTFDNLGIGQLKNIRIHHNFLHNGTRYGLNIADGTDSLIAWNNIIANTAFAGIRINITGKGGQIDIFHNTLFNNNMVNGGDGHAPITNSWDLSQKIVNIRNNIVYGGAFSIAYYLNYGKGAVVLERNLFYGIQNGKIPIEDSNPIGGGIDQRNPRLVDPINNNFRLAIGSPAIDQAIQGRPFDIVDDYYQTPRPLIKGADVGASEYINMLPQLK